MEAVGLDEEAEEEPEDLMISLVDISTPVKEGEHITHSTLHT